ncbi:MAG: hypothetical protein PHP85_12910 [Gallionella sp.]|nr:hypothetical protein [Gallionella sp.]
MNNSFAINWGTVADGGRYPSGWQVYALWPAPVNDDECFKAAGFFDFQSMDENYSEAYWDEQAEILQQRLVEVFVGLGKPALLSKPLCAGRRLLNFWTSCKPLPLSDQLNWPALDDNLPQAVVRFGELAEVRTGNGHRLYWIALSPDCPLNFTGILLVLAKGWPRRCVQLDWTRLG